MESPDRSISATVVFLYSIGFIIGLKAWELFQKSFHTALQPTTANEQRDVLVRLEFEILCQFTLPFSTFIKPVITVDINIFHNHTNTHVKAKR